MAATAPELLTGASSEFLKRFAPFNQMEPEALAFLGERVHLAYHLAGSVILSPAMGTPEHFFIIQRGKLQSRPAASTPGFELASMALGPGECFPVGAISAQRASTNHYVALEDSFVFQLPADDFRNLMRISPVFHLFCTQYIASLLNQSRQQLQTAFSQRTAEQQTMAATLSELIKHEPIHVPPEMSARAALEVMAQHSLGCLVIVDDAIRPLGVLTQSDLLPRVVLPGFDLERPIVELMTAGPHTLSATASAYEAVLEMTTHGVRHLLVVDSHGSLKGVVSERDLFALQRVSLRQVRANIDSAADPEAFRVASSDIRQLALNLVAQGIGSEQLTQFISALNDALTRRIIRLELERHDLQGVDLAWLAFGSEGRHEQTLFTDQDNGLIFVCDDANAREPLRQRLLSFARSVNETLAACGFPLCKGNIMASNPELCLTPREWQRRFDSWIGEPDPQALLNASIFFDFRVILGKEQLGDKLRAWLNKAASRNPAFLRMMAGNAISVAPPLGRIRDFVLEDDGMIDLKTGGARLFVDAARILALRAGVSSSSTAQRLRQAGAKIGMQPDELAAYIDGFHFIQLLRLRSQHLGDQEVSGQDNRIRPDELNELDRRILKETFRQARKLQNRLKLDYQL